MIEKIKIKETPNFIFKKELVFELQNKTGRYSKYKINDHIEKVKIGTGFLFRSKIFPSDIIIDYEIHQSIEDIDFNLFIKALEREINRLIYIFTPKDYLSKKCKEISNKIYKLIKFKRKNELNEKIFDKNPLKKENQKELDDFIND